MNIGGGSDVTYGPSDFLPSDSRFRADRVGRWPLVLALADDHPLASKRRISARDLQAERIILAASEKDEEDPWRWRARSSVTMFAPLKAHSARAPCSPWWRPGWPSLAGC
ncbi:LysR substrate-binding domain-containing protein [Paraburkholderia elongata]|uniref:LysR substrate-binding domain-containing protein n=1 Tax=Paraburkholderia elongata TaxID=2675747 RepID=A0A972NZ50_9BURK|nr:LysR substrate-binding domain-containing protein [Paraburkholderia elongata]NPT61552.1 hypothetical protein [Paraburkholderia elongata]